MTTLYKYRFYCYEENMMVTQWGETPPTICPNDHADKTFDLNSLSIIDTISTNKVISDDTSTGYFCTEQYIHEIAACPIGCQHTFDIIWDENITLWKTIFSPTVNLIGDEVKVIAAPDTLIGAVTATININDTVINVSPTVTANIKRGFPCIINDGTNEYIAPVKSIDALAGTITIKTGSTFAFNPGTLIYTGLYLIRYLKIFDDHPISMGDKGLKGKEIPSGTIVRIYHKNNDGAAKQAVWRAEFYNNE